MPAVPASPPLPAVGGFDDFALTLLEVALTGFIGVAQEFEQKTPLSPCSNKVCPCDS